MSQGLEGREVLEASTPAGPPPPGRLRVFFGYAEGAGMRSALLDAALARHRAGDDVVLGAFDAKERADLRARLSHLEWVGGQAREADDDLDLEGALRRRPRVLLVVPLAHLNRPGARHRRRDQDVRELLCAGIDVWATIEVGEIASLSEPCARIMGSRVRDTVPDEMLDEADDVDLVDRPVDGVLGEGPPGTAGPGAPARAALVALREIALRRMADRLHERLGARGPGAAGETPARPAERLLVCVGPSPSSSRLVHTASRMASAMRAPWTAVHVRSRADREASTVEAVADHLRLAESLGADTHALDGADVAEELVHYARTHGITKLLIGKTGRTVRSTLLRGTVVDRVLALSDDIDVYVVRGTEGGDGPAAARPQRLGGRPYLATAAALAVATGLSFLFPQAPHADASRTLTYLLAVAYVAAMHGRGPAVVASFASVPLFNYLFTEPRFTFAVHDPQYLFTFAVMLVIGVLVSTLTARSREHAAAARLRERRTEALYHLGRQLAGVSGRRQILATAAEHLSAVLRTPVAFWLPAGQGTLTLAAPQASPAFEEPRTGAIARWVFQHRRLAGSGTDEHGDAEVLCLPIEGPDSVEGVLTLRREDPQRALAPDERRHLETLAAQVGMAIAGDRLTRRMHGALAEAEAEKLRSALLSSVSHDFRTPLAAISGTSSTLLLGGERIPKADRDELLQSIGLEADRLARLVDNLLHLTRIESGRFPLEAEWHVVEDLVGSALHRAAGRLAAHRVETHLAPSLPLIRVDGVLVEQAIVNLLENAARFSAPGTAVETSAAVQSDLLVLTVSDRGPGVPDDEKTRVFEKFYRGRSGPPGTPRGTGLGLAICHAVAALHGGSAWVEDRPSGGACFRLALPIEPQPPAIPTEDPAS